MIRIKTAMILILLLCAKQLKGNPSIPIEVFFNPTIGYQGGYDSKFKNFKALDINVYFLWYNCGYDYQFSVGHKAFLGVGHFNLAQIQLGYAFNTKDFLIRYRSDFPLSYIKFFFTRQPKGVQSSKLHNIFSTVGFFVESKFNDGYYNGMAVGLTLGLSIWDVNRTINKRW